MKMYGIISVIVVSLCVAIFLTGCQASEAKPDAQAVEIPPEQPEQQPMTETVPNTMAEVENDVPVVTVENAVHDFGLMGPNARDKCEFKFTNTGKGTLKIKRVQSTCGCTVPQLKIKEYAPGESGTIGVSFHAPRVKSMVSKHLYIVSNDPKTPRSELTIKAQVAVEVEISPEKVELRLDQDNAGMPNIVVKSLDGREFSVTGVTIPNQVMEIPFDAAKKAAEFTLEPAADIEKLNQFNTGVIQVETDHPQAGSLTVRYNVKAKFEVSRPRIILQNVEPGVSVTKDVLIRSNYGDDVEIASVESRNGYMEIESQEKDGEHLQLLVKITPPEREASPRRYITDELKIKLKNGTELKIRCSGWFKLK